MTKIVAFINHKGGVGKTTSCINLNAALKLHNKKVLMIDIDPQANLTSNLGLPTKADKNIYGALRGDYPLSVTVLDNGFHIVPSTLDLLAAEIEFSTKIGREVLLKHLLQPVISDYDYIFIDCPPSLGLLTLNALSVANFMIIPMETSRFSIEGMNRLFEIVDLIKSSINPQLTDYRILRTLFASRTTLHSQLSKAIENIYKEKMFKTIIRNNIYLQEAQVQSLDIFTYHPKSNGAKDYMKVSKEFLKVR